MLPFLESLLRQVTPTIVLDIAITAPQAGPAGAPPPAYLAPHPARWTSFGGP